MGPTESRRGCEGPLGNVEVDRRARRGLLWAIFLDTVLNGAARKGNVRAILFVLYLSLNWITSAHIDVVKWAGQNLGNNAEHYQASAWSTCAVLRPWPREVSAALQFWSILPTSQ